MTMVISTSPANRYVSLVNCVCSMSLLNRKDKPTESNTSVRRKRQVKQCLFRHCSGLVCAQKLLRRRRNKQHCVHLRVSQDAIHGYWNVRNKSTDDSIRDKYSPDTRAKGEKVVLESMKSYCEIEHKERTAPRRNDDCTKEMVLLTQSTNKEKSKLATFLKSSRVRFNKRCSDQDVSRTVEANIVKDICYDKTRLFSKCVNEGNPDTLEEGINLYSINNTDAPRNSEKASDKKRSHSDTSFSETVLTDNCVDSILYRQLRKTCVRSVETKLAEDRLGVDKTIELKLTPMSELERIEKISSHLENVNRTVNNFLDDVRTFSFKQRQQYNLQHSINKRESSSRLPNKFPSRNIEIARNSQQESISPVSWHKSTTSQKLRKYLCQDCYCESKTHNYNNTQWSSSRKRSSSPRLSPYPSHHPRYRMTYPQSPRNDYSLECLRPKRKIDSTVYHKLYSSENRSSRQRLSREKPTLLIYKNRKSNRLNSTNSAYSSSSSARNSSVTCRCSTCKSSRYSMHSSNRYKRSGNTTEIDYDLLSSLSSFSCKRCRSCSMLTQNSTNDKRERISSSSCASVCRWTGTHPAGNEEKSSPYLSSTSCSCSLSSLSTFRDDYNSEGTNGEPEKIERPWIGAGCRKLKRKKILCKDKYHVRWNY
ncbi:uncharacterized protein LOC113465191 isoform X2 [Ceratina calcarata]|uniref:Uncharacterized protein LOC113465191 isoform X2 n=1 Tax=Ceratina calcarata TaxID=156304 RepID=A0AAJ7WGC1_9HYME|nr:uncharacterized protein LOC113465191 isoform X2 [Ceratina calcarata]